MKSIYTINFSCKWSGIIACNIVLMIFLSLSIPDENFASAQESNSSNNDIVYVSKFVCSSVSGDEGPIRPGHYDTNIGIFNKQNYPISYFWNVAVSNGPTTHSILQSIEKQQSIGIICNDIKKIFGMQQDDNSLVEGFVFINVPTHYNISSPNTVVQNSDNRMNLLEVQTFYTANALETLPHEVIYENISFYIINDETGKIPPEQIRTTMDVTIQSKLNQISNTETKIKQILADYYDIGNDDLDKISVRIKNISIGVSTLIDDHAISLHVVSPQSTNRAEN
ncbi:MAG: hypothetical protein ACREAK_04340 [Nitrosarchaeum sp.]